MNSPRIPLYADLVRYVEDRLPPGSFLRAVLENDFRQAVSRADPESLARLLKISEAINASQSEVEELRIQHKALFYAVADILKLTYMDLYARVEDHASKLRDE